MPNKYIVYYEEVIAKLEKDIVETENRLSKAREIGADKEDNKWNTKYKELVEKLDRQSLYLAEYKSKIEKFNNGTKRPNEQKEDLRQTGTNDLVTYAEQIGLTESQT